MSHLHKQLDYWALFVACFFNHVRQLAVMPCLVKAAYRGKQGVRTWESLYSTEQACFQIWWVIWEESHISGVSAKG